MSYVGKVNAGGAEHLVGSTLYGTCSTASVTAAKVVTCANFDKLIEGVTIHVKFTYSDTASGSTMNVNGTGAKPIKQYGNQSASGNSFFSWPDGSIVAFTYDGTNWVMNGKNEFRHVYQDLITTASDLPILLAYSTTNTVNKVNMASSIKGNPSTGNIQATKFNGYTLGAACEKAIGSVTSGNTGLVTGGAVYTAIQSAAAGSLQYQGTATSDSDIGTSYHAGWYWVVGSAGGTIAGQTVEAGDMVLAHADYSGTLADDLDIVQSNVDRITNSDIDTIVAA